MIFIRHLGIIVQVFFYVFIDTEIHSQLEIYFII